ncbi:MAG: PAS domain S-box protein, partial [Ignavibacteriaceae bacterium]|nr:PAS domain S-box protein [Ignavibacteriaceae bacterium]
KFIGVTSVRFNTLNFSTLIQSNYTSFDLTIATKEGFLILHDNWNFVEVGKKVTDQFNDVIERTDREEFFRRFLSGDSGKMELKYIDRSDKLIVFFTPVDFADLLISISISENEAMEEINDLIYTTVPKGIALIIFVLILTFISIGKIINPLANITKQINELSEKKELNKLTTKSNDEISVLVNSFNKLVDELSKRETELNETKNRLNFALQASKDGIYDHNLQLNTLYFSDRMFEMLGYSPSEFTPSYKQFLGMIYHEDLESTLKSIEDAEINQTDSNFEMRVVKKDGELIWIRSKGMVVQRDNSGKSIRIVGTFTDVTERKNYESQILELNRSLERKVHERTIELQFKLNEIHEINIQLNSQKQALNAAAVVSVTDSSDILLEVNEEFCRISKYSQSELIGQSYRILNSGYHSKEFWGNIYNLLYSGNIVREKICNKAKDGSLFWLDSVIVPVKGSSQKIERFFTVSFDVTEIVKSEKALSLAEKKSRTILEAITEGIFGTDLNGIITFVNPAACNILGFTEEEMIGKDAHILFHHSFFDGNPYPIEECPMHKSLKNGEPLSSSEFYWKKDGNSIPVEFSSNPFFADGKIDGAVVSFRDVTIKRKLEEELNTALRKADNALKLANAGFWNLPLEQYEFIQQSQKTAEILGLHPTADYKYPLKLWRKLLNDAGESTAKTVFEKLKNLIAGRSENYDIVYSFKRPIDGKVIWVRELAVKNKDYLGNSQVFGVIQDITKMKLIEEELSLAANAANSIIDNIPIPTSVNKKSDNTIVRINKAMADFHGLRIEEIQGSSCTEWYENQNDIEKIRTIINNEGEVTNYPVKFKRLKTGELRDTLVSYRLLKYFGNDCFVSSILDITDITRVEKELALSLSTADSIIDSIMIPTIVAKTADGSVLRVNKAMAEFHQMAANELLSTKATEWYFNPKERENLISELNLNGFVTNVELQLRRKKTGEIRSVLVSMIKMKYYDEEDCQVGSFMDITEIKKIQSELEEAKKIAEDATQAKSNFLATMSHEIRTPMNAVLGLTNILLKTELTYKQYDYLSKIDRSAFSLMGIINDILDFSKIEAGKIQLENIPFDLESLLDTLSNNIAMKAQEKGLEFALRIHPNVPLNLLGDPLRIGQILTNFCSNAVKFTNKGEVVITVSINNLQDDKVEIIFVVKDTGIGIDSVKINKLFSAFQQADSSITRKFGGTGLGLAISRKLSDLMHGKIWVESLEGIGSKFYFSVELGVQNLQKRKKFIPAPDLRGMKVLVVDDNESSCIILKEILTSFTFKVSTVSSGQEAIQELREHSDDPFDLMLIDWKMPGLDGIETTEKINDEFSNHAPVIVMVTGFGKEDIAHKASEIGIQGFLTKPVSSSNIFNLIMKIFHKEGKIIRENVITPQLSESDMSAFSGLKLLLVEDNEINQIVATEMLSEIDISCDVASNGEIALKILNESQPDNYAAVLMDIQMPVMDGFTTTREIKKIDKYKNLPIIAMTADAMVGVKEQCLEAGMVDYVSKPINP